MTEPLVIRINQILTEDEFRYVSRKLKQDNPNIIVLPAYCEVLHPQIIRCKDCKYCSIDNYADGNVPIYECTFWDNGTSADGYCHEAQRREE